MRIESDMHASYINKCITRLNSLIYIAIDQEMLRSNPHEEVRYEKKETSQHKHISKDNLKLLMETVMPDSRLELIRRAFIFSSLTGLVYVDMHRLFRTISAKWQMAGSISANRR